MNFDCSTNDSTIVSDREKKKKESLKRQRKDSDEYNVICQHTTWFKTDTVYDRTEFILSDLILQRVAFVLEFF